MSSQNTSSQLPAGWVQQFDDRTKHPFWVDTKASPPRAIWVHPYEDEQFLNEHPEIKERLSKKSPDDAPPAYARRHSFSGSTPPQQRKDSLRLTDASLPTPDTTGSNQANTTDRGFFGKLKDSAIGTKEEREEAKKRERALNEQAETQRQRALVSQYNAYDPYAPGNSLGTPSRAGYGYATETYAYYPPPGDPYLYGNGLGGYGGMGGLCHSRRRHGYGGGYGVGVPLVGGLAGGLILGEALEAERFDHRFGHHHHHRFDGGYGGGYGWGGDRFGGPWDGGFGGAWF